MSDREQMNMLFNIACNDLKALSGMVDHGIFSDEIFGFHAQQAVEKALKVWISLINGEFPFVHDLRVLFKILRLAGEDVQNYEHMVDFNDYAVELRYHNDDSREFTVDRLETIEDIAELIDHVRDMIAQTEREK